jgi:L-fucose mutarotase/ribose pyranase (RbsD/FucU family)
LEGEDVQTHALEPLVFRNTLLMCPGDDYVMTDTGYPSFTLELQPSEVVNLLNADGSRTVYWVASVGQLPDCARHSMPLS